MRLPPPGSTCSSHTSYDTGEARRNLPEVNGKISFLYVRLWSGADPGGGARGPGGPGAQASPLTQGFEAPKLSIFGPYLIFP